MLFPGKKETFLKIQQQNKKENLYFCEVLEYLRDTKKMTLSFFSGQLCFGWKTEHYLESNASNTQKKETACLQLD